MAENFLKQPGPAVLQINNSIVTSDDEAVVSSDDDEVVSSKSTPSAFSRATAYVLRRTAAHPSDSGTNAHKHRHKPLDPKTRATLLTPKEKKAKVGNRKQHKTNLIYTAIRDGVAAVSPDLVSVGLLQVVQHLVSEKLTSLEMLGHVERQSPIETDNRQAKIFHLVRGTLDTTQAVQNNSWFSFSTEQLAELTKNLTQVVKYLTPQLEQLEQPEQLAQPGYLDGLLSFGNATVLQPGKHAAELVETLFNQFVRDTAATEGEPDEDTTNRIIKNVVLVCYMAYMTWAMKNVVHSLWRGSLIDDIANSIKSKLRIVQAPVTWLGAVLKTLAYNPFHGKTENFSDQLTVVFAALKQMSATDTMKDRVSILMEVYDYAIDDHLPSGNKREVVALVQKLCRAVAQKKLTVTLVEEQLKGLNFHFRDTIEHDNVFFAHEQAQIDKIAKDLTLRNYVKKKSRKDPLAAALQFPTLFVSGACLPKKNTPQKQLAYWQLYHAQHAMLHGRPSGVRDVGGTVINTKTAYNLDIDFPLLSHKYGFQSLQNVEAMLTQPMAYPISITEFIRRYTNVGHLLPVNARDFIQGADLYFYGNIRTHLYQKKNWTQYYTFKSDSKKTADDLHKLLGAAQPSHNQIKRAVKTAKELFISDVEAKSFVHFMMSYWLFPVRICIVKLFS